MARVLPEKFKNEIECGICGTLFIPNKEEVGKRINCKTCEPVLGNVVVRQPVINEQKVVIPITEERVREIIKEELAKLNLDKPLISYENGVVNIDSISNMPNVAEEETPTVKTKSCRKCGKEFIPTAPANTVCPECKN